jgi:hypothetical protein
VLERPRFLLSEDDHLAGALGESLEHGGWCFLPASVEAEFLMVVWCRGVRSDQALTPGAWTMWSD